MTYKINFIKMHGLGNDFIMLQESAIRDILDIPYFSRTITNRYTGIGCDQLIIYSSLKTNCNMYILNPDGSYATQCGNATRCLAYLICCSNNITTCIINVNRKALYCNLINGNKVSVNMGKTSFREKWMPKVEQLNKLSEDYNLNISEILCVDVGNPHLVIFSNNLTLEEKTLLGSKLEYHSLFSSGINVNFVEVSNRKLKLQVWERGTGFTLACGSGACASFAAAKKLGFVDSKSEVIFKIGTLAMEYKDKGNGDNEIIMTGATSFVAKGIYYYDK